MHQPLIRCFLAAPETGRRSRRTRAGTARQSLAHAAFVHAHTDSAHLRAALNVQVDRHHKLNVRTVDRGGVHLRQAVQVQAVQLTVGAEHHHGVRVTHRNGQASTRSLQAASRHQAVLATLTGSLTVNEAPRTHINRVALFGARHSLHAGTGTNLDGLAHLKLNQALSAQVLHERAHTVAAHFSDRAVTVAVVHEPDSVRVLLEQLLTRAGGGATGSTNEAVRANAEVSVASAGYQLGGKGNFCVLIRQKDEVVTGAVTLGEGQACQLAPDGRVLAHMLSLRLVTCPFMILPRQMVNQAFFLGNTSAAPGSLDEFVKITESRRNRRDTFTGL